MTLQCTMNENGERKIFHSFLASKSLTTFSRLGTYHKKYILATWEQKEREMIWHNDLIFEVQQIYRNVRHIFLTDMKSNQETYQSRIFRRFTDPHLPRCWSTHETLTDLMLDELLTEGKSRVKCCCSFRRPILPRRYSSPDDSPPNSLREQPHDDLEVQGVGPNGKFPHVRPLQFKSSTKAALCSTRMSWDAMLCCTTKSPEPHKKINWHAYFHRNSG